jgi:hypothetical protein
LVVPSCGHQNTILKKHKAMSQKKRTDKNSTSAALSGFAGAIDDVPLPDGISLRSEEEHVIWNQFTRARIGWRDMDFLTIPIMIFENPSVIWIVKIKLT